MSPAYQLIHQKMVVVHPDFDSLLPISDASLLFASIDVMPPNSEEGEAQVQVQVLEGLCSSGCNEPTARSLDLPTTRNYRLSVICQVEVIESVRNLGIGEGE